MKGSQLKNGAILSYVNIIVYLAIGFLISPFIIRKLGTSEYGIYSLIASLVGYVSILDFGMHNVIVRYVAKYNAKHENEKQANFLAISIIIYSFITFLVIIVGYFLYNNIELFFNKSLTVEEIQIAKKLFVILIINLAISLPGGLFTAVVIANERFVFSKTTNIIKIILRTILVYIVLNLGDKINRTCLYRF